MDLLKARKTLNVLAEVAEERQSQNAKWGEQNHPDGTGPDVAWIDSVPILICSAAGLADHFKQYCQSRGEWSEPDQWIWILLEEVAEAFAESDSAKLREELIQVAAVAVSWVEAIDRRG